MWHYNSSSEIIRFLSEFAMEMQPRPTHVVLGARWRQMSIGRQRAVLSIARSFPDVEWVWQSSSYSRGASHSNSSWMLQLQASEQELLKQAANYNWRTVDLMRASAALSTDCYLDSIHVTEMGSTHFNKQLLSGLD